ncbi:hypothetical protein CDAR_605631 [Caerostris darwini]|uniref:Uncharacterized protein n=1 Tax=Caerostris darwini TaxID=1538125 RepID=A0AAV4VB18_9ARAC|nr:hypothetical protein CDAR_605631 [Caerostris darwini]
MSPCTRDTRTCCRTGGVGSVPQLVIPKLQKDGDLVEMGKQLSRMNARGKRLDFNCVMVVDVPEIGLALKRFEFLFEGHQGVLQDGSRGICSAISSPETTERWGLGLNGKAIKLDECERKKVGFSGTPGRAPGRMPRDLSVQQLVLRKLQKDRDLVEMGKQLSWMNARGKRLDFNCVMVMDLPEIDLGKPGRAPGRGAVGSAQQLVPWKLQKDGDLVEMGKQLSWMNARGKRLDFNCVMVMEVPEIGLG